MIVHFGQEVHSVQSVQVIKFWWTRFPLILRRNRISGPILISLLSTSRSEFQSSFYSAHACILGKVSNTVGRILFVIAEWIFLAENICWILGPQSPTPLGYQHSCYMYTFVLGSLAMRGTLTLIKFPAAEDEGKCHDRKVAEMKLSFRPNWQEGRPQLAGGQRKLVWHCIALHCIAISYLRKSQVKLTRVAKFGLKNDFLRMAALTQSKRFFDYYLRAWRFIGTCQREKIQFDVEDFSSQRHASVLQCTMWQRQRCMWSVLAAHFLAVHLALHFVSMSFFCKNQYPPNSIWQLLYGCQQKIMSELWVGNLFCTIQFE